MSEENPSIQEDFINDANQSVAAVEGTETSGENKNEESSMIYNEISAPMAKAPSRPVSAFSTASTGSRSRNVSIFESMNPNTSEEYLKKYKESFLMFANKEGRVSIDPDLPILMRGLLKNPTSKQLTHWLKLLEVTDSISLDEFMCLMRQKDLRDVDSDIELRECFRMFNKQNNGVLNVAAFRNMLQSIGDKELTESEIEEMIRYAQDSENPQFILYEDCVQQLVSNIQPLVPMKKPKKGSKKATKK